MSSKFKKQDIDFGMLVLNQEIKGLEDLRDSLNEKFSAAVELIFKNSGRVILSGMGKSGHVAKKIAATLASTGTPAFFVHPGEASHGDLGMIAKNDVVILLSNSGETAELKDIIYYCKRFTIPMISIVRRKSSALVDAANISLVLPETPEAGPVSAPTTSTTMMMALGDALAVALMMRRGFKPDDFKVFHPGGKIGQSFIKVSDLMHKGKRLPALKLGANINRIIDEISSKAMGTVAILNEKSLIVGVITDGDLRGHLKKSAGKNFASLKAADLMTKNPLKIRPQALASEALATMNGKKITSLLVADEAEKLQGIIHIHDILKAGIK